MTEAPAPMSTDEIKEVTAYSFADTLYRKREDAERALARLRGQVDGEREN